MTDKVCTIDGCTNPRRKRGWCVKHYTRFLRWGDPMIVKQNQLHGLTLEERLWANVDRSGGPDACWPWTGKSVHEFGYGTIYVNELGHADGAHRVSYKLAYGDPPADRPVVRHTCDNPPCCNPAHLIPGTLAENMEDSLDRGRANPGHGNRKRGTSHYLTTLTEEDVRLIRKLWAEGVLPGGRGHHNPSREELATRFGVSGGTIKNIVLRNTWSHVL